MAGTARGDDAKEPSEFDWEPKVLPGSEGGREEPPRVSRDPAVEARWVEFEQQLAAQLARMDDVEESDLLIVEVPGFDDDAAPGTAPYAQFAAAEAGAALHTEVSGDAYLRAEFRLGAGDWAAMRSAGWSGAAEEEPNWFRDDPLASAVQVARSVVIALRERFGVAHPDLLTYRAWGPAADEAAQLDLCASTAVPVDTVDLRRTAEQEQFADGTFQVPVSQEDLGLMVGRVLRDKFDGVEVDEDGDFVLPHLGQSVFVHVLPQEPAVHIIARVVHGVRSRRGAAVETGLLNRDDVWVKWTLRERSVWQEVMVPAMPFAELHLIVMLDIFLATLERTRDDLALRTGGEVG